VAPGKLPPVSQRQGGRSRPARRDTTTRSGSRAPAGRAGRSLHSIDYALDGPGASPGCAGRSLVEIRRHLTMTAVSCTRGANLADRESERSPARAGRCPRSQPRGPRIRAVSCARGALSPNKRPRSHAVLCPPAGGAPSRGARCRGARGSHARARRAHRVAPRELLRLRKARSGAPWARRRRARIAARRSGRGRTAVACTE
jgi:hypothetical protein